MKIWNENAATQIHLAPYVPLAYVGSSGSPPSNALYFRVPVVDSRLRVKVSVLFAPNDTANAAQPDITGKTTLWLFEEEIDYSAGAEGRYLPAVNLASTTQAAPLAIPTAKPLLGYSREFVSAADAIGGELIITGNPGKLGTWGLQARYQPEAGQRFTDAEWQWIRARCNPVALQPTIAF